MATPTRTPGRVLLAVLVRAVVLLLGLYCGVLGAVVHRHRSDWGPVTVPWGLVLGLGTAILVAWTAAQCVRAGAGWFSLGWTGVLLLQNRGNAGSYLVGSDGWGWSYMILGLAALVAVVILDQQRHRPPPRLAR